MQQYEHLSKLFLAHLEEYKADLEKQLPKELYVPEDYILSLGGKRLRPILSLIACDLFNVTPQLALNSALSVELFHNFSLIHDDILDAAPLRRNQATVHKKWNTNIAILSGDVMLVKAFSVLEKYSDSEYKQLTTILSKTAKEVCEGQQFDMNFESRNDVTVNDYLNMITKKTAVLLACSLKMGAINAHANESDCENIYAFGKHLGIAFQLMDDMLDVFPHNNSTFGKQIGGDIITNKKTYLLLKTLELVTPDEKKEIKKLLALNSEFADEKINSIKNIYNKFNVQKLCIDKANEYTQIAITHLDKISVNEIKKEQLKEFALNLLNRKL